MSAPFNFEDFISGVTVDLPRESVPVFSIVHQARIDELTAAINAAAESEGGGDDRESEGGASALLAERDALAKEQDESARYLTLRCLSAQEYIDIVQGKESDLFDQLAVQTVGTENVMSRDDFERMRSVIQPAAWALFVQYANRIVEQQLVMPDFSPSNSARKATPTS